MTFAPPSITRRDRITLLIILLLAAITRLGDLSYNTWFQYDQATQSVLALDMLSGEGISWLGPESTGSVRHSPLTVWFLTIPYSMTDNPLWVHRFLSAFNVLGAGLVWWIAFRYLGGRRAAALAGIAFALHPFAIAYSRTIWVPNFLLPFLLAGLALTLLGFVEGRRWAQALSLPVLLIGLQMHFAGWLLAPAWAWLVLWNWRRIKWRALAVSVMLAGLVMLPYAIGLNQRESSAVSGRLDTMRSVIEYDLRFRTETLEKFVDVAIGVNSADRNSDADLRATRAAVPEPVTFWSLAGVLMVVGWASLWLRRSHRPYGVFFTLWIAIPVAFFIPNWTGTGIYRHHFIPLIPALCLLAGHGVAYLLDRARRYPALQLATVSIFALLTLSWAGWVFRLWHYLDQHYLSLKTPLPIHYILDVRDELRDDRDVLLIGADTHTSGTQVWESLLFNSADCVREVIALQGGITVIPDQPFVAVAPPGADPDDYLYQQYIGDEGQKIAMRPGERPYTLRRHSGDFAWSGPDLTPLGPVAFANGVQLTGYDVNRQRITVGWVLPAGRDAGYLRQFMHLLDTNGERLYGVDLDYWPGPYWCAGDQLITWADHALPDDVVGTAVTLRVGLYRVQDDGGYRYVDVVDVAGNPAAPWVEVPLVVERPNL